MSERWEKFARENAEYYILTSELDYSRPESRERFFKSGADEAEGILAESQKWLKRTESAIEIGCGVGRLTLPMSRRFRQITAIDISATMLEKLQQNCEERSVGNVRPVLPGQWPEGAAADFVYSRLVFQHIERIEEIEAYFGRIGRSLGPDGIAYLQFDTRRKSLPYRARAFLPDAMLPGAWRRGIRRVRRSRNELLALFASKGLSVVEELRPNSVDHVFLVKKASA